MTRVLPALAALAGCGGGALQPALCEADGGCLQSSVRKVFQADITRKLDLLFVVDDTAAMAPHLDALATGFAQMAARLRSEPPPISVHVGFIRAGGCDTTTRGAVCGLAAPDQYLSSQWCQRITNLTAAYDQSFVCLGDLGASNCGPAQPLAAAADWLTGLPRPGWEGFLRPEALLMIVVVAATDDASPAPPVELAARIKALKPEAWQTLAATIGPGDCAPGEVQAPRLFEFVNQFGSNGLSLGLCSGHLDAVLDRVTIYIDESLRLPCIANIRDTDLETPGLQADCTVEDIALQPDGSSTHSILPNCDVSAPPCWRLTPGFCADGGSSIEFVRAPDWCSESRVNDVVECQVYLTNFDSNRM